MGIFSKIKQGLAEAAERMRQEEAERRERMRPYYRGYDVFPEDVRDIYGSKLRTKLLITVIVQWLFESALIIAVIYVLSQDDNSMILAGLIGIVALILLLFALSSLSRLVRVMTGDFDVMGGMVVGKRVEEDTTTDSEGQTTTTYTYFLTINGIECEVPHVEYNKVKVETYCYFVRLRAKYIRDDTFILYPCDASEGEKRIDQHYPSKELRPYRRPSTSISSILLGFLCICGAIALFVLGRNSAEGTVLSDYMYWFIGGCGGLLVFDIIAEKLRKHKLTEQEIEEKRRLYGGQSDQ